jgi:2-methylcitrate dehydratase PrpD
MSTTGLAESLTARLAAFVLDTPASAFGAQLIALAESGAVDTLACALAALDEPVVRITAAAVPEIAAAGSMLVASVWGGARKAALADAAYLNAIASHALDFDDNMPSLRGHPSTTQWPTALTVGEAVGAGGAEILAAYAMGIEVTGKLGMTMGFGHYARGWHPTGTIGIFGATAVAARLLGLDAPQLCHAWGLAASQTAGLVANFGTMAKSFHAGHAVRCAVQSAQLAQAGFSTNPAIFDGPRSVIATYRGEEGEALSAQLERLARPWEIADPGLYIKVWPCCYCSHRAIAGLLALMREHSIVADEIREISVGFPPGTDSALVKGAPESGLAGKFSLAYTLAATAIDGTVTLGTFTDPMLARPQAQALMQRVRDYPVEDSRRYSSTVGYNDVGVDTARGRFSMRVNSTPGSPETPLSRSELDAKFLDCAKASLRPAEATRALHCIRGLASAADSAELAELLCNAGRPATGERIS